MPKIQYVSDEELFLRVKINDERAYAELYDRYKRSLVVFTLRKVPVDEAEDIVHDLFAKFWDNRHSLVIQDKFSAYIFKALRNRIIDYMAHLRHVNFYLQSLEEFTLNNFTHLPDYAIREKSFLDHIEKLLEKYGPKGQQIVRLRMQGYSNEEIAARLGLSEKSVRNQYSILLKHLKDKLSHLLVIYFFF